MTRVIDEIGKMIPVTVIKCSPNTVVQIKNQEKDGYTAVLLGADKLKKERKTKKYSKLKEFQTENIGEYEKGQEVTLDILKDMNTVTVTGISKGKGFQGVIKRHNFARGPETHGSHHHREPGSIGQCNAPGKVQKGKKMPGHMGASQVTLKNVKIMKTDIDKSIVALKGAIPGGINSTVFIKDIK